MLHALIALFVSCRVTPQPALAAHPAVETSVPSMAPPALQAAVLQVGLSIQPFQRYARSSSNVC